MTSIDRNGITKQKIQGELPRIPIPRTSVNKGKKKDQVV